MLSIPAILGALVLQLRNAGSGAFGLVELGAGFAAAFAAGVLSLWGIYQTMTH